MKLKTTVFVLALTITAAPVSATDWQGWRAGVAVGAGSYIESYQGFSYSKSQEVPVEAFLGYDWQRDRRVFGLEVDYGAISEVWSYTNSINPEHGIGQAHALDLKGRLGYVFGERRNALAYVFTGIGGVHNTSRALNQSLAVYTSQGYTMQAGVGIEYHPDGKQLFVGAEAGMRSSVIDFPTAQGVNLDGAFIKARIGWKF